MTPAALATRIPLIDADESNRIPSRLMQQGAGNANDQLVVLYQLASHASLPQVAWLERRRPGRRAGNLMAAFPKKGPSIPAEMLSLWTWLTIITLNACRSRLRRQTTFNRIRALIPSYRNNPSATESVDLDETCRRVRAAQVSKPERTGS